VNAEIH